MLQVNWKCILVQFYRSSSKPEEKIILHTAWKRKIQICGHHENSNKNKDICYLWTVKRFSGLYLLIWYSSFYYWINRFLLIGKIVDAFKNVQHMINKIFQPHRSLLTQLQCSLIFTMCNQLMKAFMKPKYSVCHMPSIWNMCAIFLQTSALL